MAGPPAVTVTGAAEFQRAIRKMGDELDDPEFHRRPAEAVRDRALDRVPRVSGALADTIDVVVGPGGSEIVAGSPLVPYAGVIEHGWDDRNIEAARYLAGALDDLGGQAGQVHDVYADQVGDLVERVGRES